MHDNHGKPLRIIQPANHVRSPAPSSILIIISAMRVR